MARWRQGWFLGAHQRLDARVLAHTCTSCVQCSQGCSRTALTEDTAAYQLLTCALLVSEHGVSCRRPGYRSTAEHILTLCKDKEYAVPFLAGQYQKSLIDHALHRLDSQVSMVSALKLSFAGFYQHGSPTMSRQGVIR